MHAVTRRETGAERLGIGTIEFEIEYDEIRLLRTRHLCSLEGAGRGKRPDSPPVKGGFQNFASLFGAIGDKDGRCGVHGSGVSTKCDGQVNPSCPISRWVRDSGAPAVGKRAEHSEA